jgi:restriction system protein
VVRNAAHAGKHDWVLNIQQFGQACAHQSKLPLGVSAFALEKHLEDFLIVNWSKTPLGADYEIFSEDGALVGQQYSTDTGPIDILAISKDRKTLLVVELKKGRASDAVVGQILRYMGYVKDQVAEESQRVEGVIIALEDDQRLKRALSLVPSVTFFRYEVNFSLKPVATNA